MEHILRFAVAAQGESKCFGRHVGSCAAGAGGFAEGFSHNAGAVCRAGMRVCRTSSQVSLCAG